MSDRYTLGIEEEYQLVDRHTHELCGRAGKVLAAAQGSSHGEQVQLEMHRCQIEIATDVCESLGDIRDELIQSRRTVIDAAYQQQAAVVAAGTHPFSLWQNQSITDKSRYRQLARNLRQVIRELIIFGCHVHVGLNGNQFQAHPDIALEVVNRCRLWLSSLLALTANSPFWQGQDTGYSSYRTELWCRLPTAGPPPHFPDFARYQEFVQGLIRSGIIQDPTTLYWDIRLSDNFPTIEFRIADVCMTVDEATMLAGLVKALVRTCYEEVVASKPCPPVRSELLKAAHWTAARYGLTGELIDVQQPLAVPAKDYIDQFMAYLQPALEAEGDWDTVAALVQQTLSQGNGAARQRAWWQATHSWPEVVDRLIEQTAADIPREKPAIDLGVL